MCGNDIEQQGDGWVSVEDRLPESDVSIIAFGINSYGKQRILRAFYAEELTVEQYDADDMDWLDYDEKLDRYCIPKGWYERNEFEETNWKIDFPVTHWRELPPPPKK